jgi:hypothetical protein
MANDGLVGSMGRVGAFGDNAAWAASLRSSTRHAPTPRQRPDNPLDESTDEGVPVENETSEIVLSKPDLRAVTGYAAENASRNWGEGGAAWRPGDVTSSW